ncbi:uncharacterized protein E0L32_001391 [Thyridium curvatum]|uniref:Alpha/beta hydrolase fold-3 domain-containing protein n=1 Tax=Thyridium curvatum TaxID=1093900 RepID=A0A507AUM1_9PEZI|nr:uncharacterized protein E0L32_001391 [Thyridium curvatum]TPX10194.1 hypothetical protein E0L32_001391 [Thyridium curvatum]
MNTAGVGLAVTPAVVSTLFSHYLDRKPLKQKPTAHLSYDEGLHLIRSFLIHASHHTVEELQAFTSQWVPHPQWVKVEEVKIPEDQVTHAAAVIEEQLGPDGVRQVGGRKWWQWRKPNSPLKAEWIEMRADYNERKKNKDPGKRVMLYVHGGAYFFGSVDEHRYQMQRHARKLKARVFAPRYRLAPQFPFPCGLQDCLAAYLHLLTVQDPSTIILAGDSAGGGMVMSILVTLRDRGIPLPAGAILVSPWVDLTHSFPSVAEESPFDYIPASGFHHKPSRAWPPPTEDDLEELKKIAVKDKKISNKDEKIAADSPDAGEKKDIPELLDEAAAPTPLVLAINGKDVIVKEQIQMYTTNELLAHPLVSPVMQPTLGGLPPLLIMTGGGEMLRDEQIYLAHKCANPSKYLPPEHLLDDKARALLKEYKPTDVQLQVWDDLCHVAPTLSFTRPAKYMYRSIAQFGAWALARAQKTGIDILDDDQISVISTSGSDTEQPEAPKKEDENVKEERMFAQIGKAGDPLPPFKDHMIRQKVTRHGDVFPLAAPAELPGCCLDRELIGVPKQGPVGKWLQTKQHFNSKFSGTKDKMHKRRLKDFAVGYETFGEGEYPPPSALAGRRRIGADLSEKKKTRSMGLSLWSLWGSKHDEETVAREQQADAQPEVKTATAAEGSGSRPFNEIEKQAPPEALSAASRSRSRRRIVKDELQADHEDEVDENTSIADLLARRQDGIVDGEAKPGLLSPNSALDTGVSGKRPFLNGIAMPFSLNKEPETASMLTLDSTMDQSKLPNSRPMSPATMRSADGISTHLASPLAKEVDSTATTPLERPGMETFVTAVEDLPTVNGSTKSGESTKADGAEK